MILRDKQGRFAKGCTIVAWNKGMKMPDDFGAKISKIKKGVKLSPSTCQKMSENMKKRWATDTSLREIVIRNLPLSGKGALSPCYIHDRSKLAKKQIRNDSAYKEWRKAVRDRDGWKCQMGDETCCGKVVAHHILSWSSHPALRYDITNGITLCKKHHPTRHIDELALVDRLHSILNGG